MKRLFLNTFALAALLGGGLTFANAAPVGPSNDIVALRGPTCGDCICSDGQSCKKGWFGSCECLGDPDPFTGGIGN